MIRKYLPWFLLRFFVTAFLTAGYVRAEAIAPEALVKNVTEEVMTILREDNGIQSGNIQRDYPDRDQGGASFRFSPHDQSGRRTRLATDKRRSARGTH